ncbi:protein kinase domain-containing protein [Gimesia fumaroli]|uniref:Serine/threonine-protein kinase PknD n=1 Tax=Gimesia fumaroli TaxID=2527976 RepID=A0A518IDF2_9PLAN|nr:protein kinase [Gimesia fumaroli]QDV51132.1 Serine/threonine-protein kinase PknD [Gimesia fumaroli]
MNDIPDKDQRNDESSDDENPLNDQTQSDFEFDSEDHAPENDQTIISDQWESETISADGNEIPEDSNSEDIYQTQNDSDSELGTADDFSLNDQTIVEDSASEDINATIVAPAAVDLERTITEEDHAEWAGAQTISELPEEERPESVNDQTLVLDESENASEIGATLVEDHNTPQEIDATIVSDDVPPELVATMNSAWGDGMATMPEGPEMTIKADDIPGEDLTNQTSLVIKKRDFSDKTKSEYLNNAEYELLEVLGQGGMGVVYTARQTSIDRQVAVKMLKSKTAKNRDQRHKFLAEAVVTGELDHPNIVPIYDVGSNNSGALYYSMKKVEGRPWLKTIRKNSLAENLNILMKVADAVAFAHSRSVVHRDLKPENVMLGEFGEVLVMDWGLAQSTSGFRKSNSIITTSSMGGTPAYMAPEMATGPVDKISPLSDVYLLGAILYEILTGRPPHTGKTAMKCLMAAAKNEIVPTGKKGELVDIAMKAMATQQKDRYPSVQALQQAIMEYQSHSESISLATRAHSDLKGAKATENYELFSRALFGFQEALSLWPENHAAKAGAEKTTLSYASTAYSKGDFDLGLSLLSEKDPAHTELIEQIRSAQTERDARQQRLRTAKRVFVGMLATVLVVVTGAFFWIRAEANRALKAEEVAETERDTAIEERKKADAARAQESIALQKAVVSEKKAIAEKEKAEEAQRQEVVARQKEIIARQKAVKSEKEAITAKEKEEYEAYIARIGLAAAKIDENAFESAIQLLNGCPEELRNWEWGRLMHLCSQSSRTFNAKAPVDALAVSNDGSHFVTGGKDGFARLWDRASGKMLAQFDHNKNPVLAVALSPDGKTLATGSEDRKGFIKLWDLETHLQIQRTFQDPQQKMPFDKGHTEGILSISYSKDGTRLLTSSYDKTARLWDVASGQQLRRFWGHNWWVWDANFSTDERRIVTASQDGTAVIWSVETGKQGAPFTGHQGPVYSAHFSPDDNSTHVVTSGYDRRVLLWKPEDIVPYDFNKIVSGKKNEPPPFIAFDGHQESVQSAEFTPDGTMIISASHDNTVKLWDIETTKALKTLRGHDSWVQAATLLKDGKWILSASHDARLKLWNIADYEEIRTLKGRVLAKHVDAILDVSFSKDGTQLVTASRDKTAISWNVATGKPQIEFTEGHAFLASNAVFLPDHKRLATAAVDNSVRIWDIQTGTEHKRFEHTGRSAAIDVSSDSRFLLTGSDKKTVRLWNIETGKLIRELTGHRSEVSAVAFSPDLRFCASGDARGRCMLWEVATGKLLHQLEGHTRRISVLKFLPDRKTLLSASGDNTVGNWNITTGKENRKQILKHPDAILSMDVFANGKQAVTSCADGLVRIWDLSKPEVVQTIKPANGLINSVSISHDNKRLLTANVQQRVIQVWSVDSGKELLVPGKNGKLNPFLDFKKQGGMLWTAIFSPYHDSILTVGGRDARLWNGMTAKQIMAFHPHGVVASASFSPDGNWLVTGSWDNSAKIWNTKTGHAEKKLEQKHQGYVNTVRYSPNGKQILTASDDGTAKLWDANSGAVLLTLELPDTHVKSAIFSPDGSQIVTASDDKTLVLWDAKTGQKKNTFKGHAWPVLEVAYSHDGKHLISGSEDNSAIIWEIATQKKTVLAGHTAPVASVVFSPDDSRAFTASEDGTAKLWDAETGKEILTLSSHTQGVTSVDFSPNGRYVATGSQDGQAILWLTVDWKNKNAAQMAISNR